ncbi:hypothetical protein [Parendozoicomonas sp. Alg238-R29]|uniref:hypothetical protein n=1 Tax=Parendozoicomonas sp. Alg238-R29 TaxID=2993446 RepID=UPI00248E81E0|nr:hypothetical protein [Parendozoicomonas sp. Alg238-R29]
MSCSKLYRQLKSEGSSYSNILDQVRQKDAGKYKSTGMGDSNIAINLGFQEAASNYKTRKRWQQKIT